MRNLISTYRTELESEKIGNNTSNLSSEFCTKVYTLHFSNVKIGAHDEKGMSRKKSRIFHSPFSKLYKKALYTTMYHSSTHKDEYTWLTNSQKNIVVSEWSCEKWFTRCTALLKKVTGHKHGTAQLPSSLCNLTHDVDVITSSSEKIQRPCWHFVP